MASVDYCAIPAQEAAEGQTTNLIDPTNLSVPIVASTSFLMSISFIFLLGRLFMNRGKWKLADYLAIAGFAMTAGFSGTLIALRTMTRHMWDTPACWYMSPYFLKLLFALNMLTAPTQFTVKLAILVLYLQIFSVNPRTRYAILATIIGGAMIYFVYAVLIIVYEAPRAGESWLAPYDDGRLLHLMPYGPIRAMGGLIMDFCILLLPFPILRKLHVTQKKKIQLSAIFVTGALGVTASIVSTYWCFRILLDKPGDQSWQQSQIFIWLMVEQNVAVIVACMPATAAFVRIHLIPRTHHNTTQSSALVDAESHKLVDQRKAARRPKEYYYQLGDSLLNTQTDTTIIGQAHTMPSETYQPGKILVTKQFAQEDEQYSFQ